MADPKYKNLPYIAAEEQDVYETEDLPEADQTVLTPAEGDDVVESIMVDPKDAFLRFNKATIDSRFTDFSERAGKGNRGLGVSYEILPQCNSSAETVEQKLQRLKCEIRELQELSSTRFDQTDASPVAILSEIEQLQHQVASFSEPSLALAGVGNKGESYSMLLNQLRASQKKGSPTKAATASCQPNANEVQYELRYTADSMTAGLEGTLEARISQLERVVGSQPNVVSAINEGTGQANVMDALATMTSKLQLLDEDKVDKLSARYQLLLQSLNKLSESGNISEARNLDKINELYDLVKKWDESAETLPAILDRLYTLQDLHEQAMQFSASLKALETAQMELTQGLGEHSQLLQTVQKTFTSNVDTIKENLSSLEKRIGSLSK